MYKIVILYFKTVLHCFRIILHTILKRKIFYNAIWKYKHDFQISISFFPVFLPGSDLIHYFCIKTASLEFHIKSVWKYIINCTYTLKLARGQEKDSELLTLEYDFNFFPVIQSRISWVYDLLWRLINNFQLFLLHL